MREIEVVEIRMITPLSVFRKRFIWLYVTAVGCLAVIVALMVFENLGFQADYGLGDYIDTGDSWTYSDGSSVDFSSLRQDAGGSAATEIYFRIPEMEGNTTLCYWSHNVYTKVFLGDELIYETDKAYSEKAPGSLWTLISLRPDQAGLTLRIQITAAYRNGRFMMDHVYWGDRAAIVLSQIRQKIAAVLVSLIIIFGGLMMVIMDIPLNHNKNRKNHGLRCLGYFALFIGGWCLIETTILQFFVGNTQILQPIDNLLLILAFMPMMLYADWTYGIFRYRPMRLLGMLHLVFLAACIILPPTGLTDWHELLSVARVFIAIFAAVFMFMVIWKNRLLYGRKGSRAYAAYLQLAGIVAICVAVVLELVRFNASDDMDSALVIRYGLLIFILCFAISSQFQTYTLIAQGMEYDSVHKLAYSDALTQLGNRVAYLKRIEECVKAHVPKLGVVFLDINNLKKVNDTHGHEQGDILIQTAAEVIRESFAPYGSVYRIGGDEFCVLLEKDPEAAYMEAMDEFRRRIKEANDSEKYVFNLQIAQGFACCEADSMETVEDTVKTADEKMYRNKVQLKRG